MSVADGDGQGVDGRLHTWMFDHADENRDEIYAITAAGAYIMGRNMFGPIRGEWDLDWMGCRPTTRRFSY
jgi:dihydrofolate reductase